MSDSEYILDQFQGERERAHHIHGEHSQEENAWDSHNSMTILFEEMGEIAKVFNERNLGQCVSYGSVTSTPDILRKRQTMTRHESYRGVNVDHLYADCVSCPQPAKLQTGWVDPEGTDICGLCLNRWRKT